MHNIRPSTYGPQRDQGDRVRGDYNQVKALVTGHTGFKGAWLSEWLKRDGAIVAGLALPPETNPNLFEAARIAEGMTSLFGDIRDMRAVRSAMEETRPDIVFHLAAQPLVRRSYRDPIETFATNGFRHDTGFRPAILLRAGIEKTVAAESERQ